MKNKNSWMDEEPRVLEPKKRIKNFNRLDWFFCQSDF